MVDLPLYNVGGNGNGCSHCGNFIWRFPSKLKVGLSLRPSRNLTSAYIYGGNDIMILKRYLHPHGGCSIITNSQDMEISCVSTDEGNGTPLQHSCLENPMDGGAWWAAVHGVATSQTQLSDFTFTFHFHALEKEMAAHSSVLAWRIPGTGAWWAAVYGVAQSRTRLTRLSSNSSSSYR